MVNDSLPDPLTARLLDQHVDPINQEDGSHSPGTLLQSSRQGLRSQLLQRDSDRDSNTPQDLLLSRTQLTSTGGHEQDEDEYDDEYDDDEATSETQPVLMSKSTRMKATDKRRRTPGYPDHSQLVHLEEEDVHLKFTGYQYVQIRLYIYYLACLLSGGVLFLLGRWMPKYYISFVAITCRMGLAEFVVIEDEWDQLFVETVRTKYYGGLISTVFSPEQMEIHGDEGHDSSEATGVMHDMRFFDYQYIRFIYNPIAQTFMQNSHWKDPEWTSVGTCEKGLERGTHQERSMVFGQNLIDVEEKTVGQLLVQEVLHPFYIFQVFSMALWISDEYYYYAACIFVISTASVITELVETKKTMRRMRNMSKFTCNVKVCRTGRWRYIGSEELVPGDVFEVTDSELSVFPCDAVLLTGDCIVNESMLTGESVPVSKIPVTERALEQLDLSLSNIPSEIARHFLFSGTKIVRARPGAGSKKNLNTDDAEYGMSQPARGLAMVVRTGFNTTKGALIRSMLFPKPKDFQFYRDSFRFIGILACIAFGGFIVSTINFIRIGVPPRLMLTKALDLITIVVPPALPATMSIGTSFAIARLKRSDIFCISPTRVNISGKINCMCFDKTGTLTEDGLDVLGVQCGDAETGMFGELLIQAEDLQSAPDSMQDRCTPLLHAMATCHSVKSVGGELIGDPLDLKMFEFTRWILEEGALGVRTSGISDGTNSRGKSQVSGVVSTVVRPPGAKKFDLDEILSHRPAEMSKSESFLELGIIRCFEFVSSLRRMSVIVRKLHSPGMDIYVKGAPEAMTDICLKETLPADYKERLAYYTHHGYRVIACAAKSMPTLNFVRAQRIKREQVESELTFLGFIVFENKLKPTTAPVVATLSNARIRQVMCTGDNVLTAISVSKECGLVDKKDEVYAPRFVFGNSTTENSKIVWENIDEHQMTLDPVTLKPTIEPGFTRREDEGYSSSARLANSYVLAVTGDCFRWMVDYAPTSTLNRMLVKGQIFARMSPDEKHELVENLQGLGYCVGFCGDGANDCGALKAADVGISLSEAEASVAAPFTSRSNDIGCVVKVIQEGRAALVTSFSCFKYMALYSIIQFTTVGLLYSFASNLGDFEFLYIDLLLIMPIAVFMGRTEAFPVLSPKRPTANLVSKKVLTSLIGQIIIQGCFQAALFVIVRQQPWYQPPKYKQGERNIECLENTVLFFLSIFQYLFVAVVFSVGPPYRKPMSTNRPFVLTIVGLVTLSAVIVLFPSEWTYSVLQLLPIPLGFRVFILFVATCHFVLAQVSEHYVFPVIAAVIGNVLQNARERSENKQRDAQRGYHYLQQQQQQQQQLEEEQHHTRIDVDPVGFDDHRTGGGWKDERDRQAKAAKKGGKIYKDVEQEFNL